ncbi:MAG TPA: hypothetical protein VLE51_00510 [Candidatus Saccharimonadales bacterium]|nr:hypothetical protein [Candidatus Saccharimonadales bacterium]
MTEVATLYPVEGTGRDFDALVGPGLIAGRITLSTAFEDGPRTIVYYDREQPLDGVYAVRHGGSLEEIADDDRAKELIIAGIETTNQ